MPEGDTIQETPVGEDARVKTGIKGFDELIGGGIPEGNIILVSGTAGTGKSLFALSYAYNGAKLFDEPALYITFEETAERFIHNAKKMGFPDLDEVIASKKLAIVHTEVFEIDKLLTTIEDLIDQYQAKRVVIDSISVLSAFSDQPFQVRRTLFDLSNMLKRVNVTAMLTSGMRGHGSDFMGVSIEEYVTDGVISIFHKMTGTQFIRAISIIKMRGTEHSESLHPLVIRKDGMTILKGGTFPENFEI